MPNKKKGSFDHYNDPLPSRLRALMKDHNITQDQLSKAVGVSRGSIGQYANGDSAPKYDALIAIAKYFNVSTDYLLGLANSRSVDISTREICARTNLTDGAFSALSSLSRSDIDRIFIANEIIEYICSNPAFLDDFSRYFDANLEILYSTTLTVDLSTGNFKEYSTGSGGALVLDPDGDEMALLRFKVSRGFDLMLDDITQSRAASNAAAAFTKAHPERFWKDADGNIAGPIWYVPARSGDDCYPVHLTFAQYEAEIKAVLDGDIVKEPYNAQLVKLFEDAAIQHDYNGDTEQFKADQQARSDARKKRLNYGILPEENE